MCDALYRILLAYSRDQEQNSNSSNRCKTRDSGDSTISLAQHQERPWASSWASETIGLSRRNFFWQRRKVLFFHLLQFVGIFSFPSRLVGSPWEIVCRRTNQSKHKPTKDCFPIQFPSWAMVSLSISSICHRAARSLKCLSK